MDMIETLKDKLKAMGLVQLRQLGRAAGVANPTALKKDELIEGIVAIAENRAEPATRSGRGKPPKSDDFDKEALAEIMRMRELAAEGASCTDRGGDYICSSDEDAERVYSGVLEYTEKFWFVRTANMQITPGNDVFVHVSFVNRFRLRPGDKIVCKAKRRRPGECPGATFIVSINGKTPDSHRCTPFENLTPCYPDRRIVLEHAGCSVTERVIDLFSPVGFGQRALIVSPPKAGKTTMLKDIACALRKNYPETIVVVLLIDERPEEVTDISRSVDGAEVVYSTFDRGDGHHVHTAALTLDYAKRQVEAGKDVVILLDSITRLTRAHNALSNSGRTLSGGLDPQALVEPKRFFGSARNIEKGGSLTIIATALVDTGSRLDDIIYEEFKSTGNMEIVLSRQLAERRVFPAVDIRASGARKEELLLNEQELKTSALVRGLLAKKLPEEDVISAMKGTSGNAEFCTKSQAFFKVYTPRQ